MTISTTASSTTVVLIAAQTVVPFSFIADAASDITVQTTNTSTGLSTTLTSSQYTVTLNSATTGQLWSVGGYVTLNSAPGVGYTCTITRTLPLQQLISIQNQGDFAPQVTEQALDTLCMEIQQVSARTGSYRGVWATGVVYNFGDIVQDGVNGAYTNNIYVCAIANTSGTWAMDLESGDWSLALNVQTLSATVGYLPLSGGTISGNLGVTGTTTLANVSSSGTVSGTGFSNYLASPPAIGGTAPSTLKATTIQTTGNIGIGAAASGTYALNVVQAGSNPAYFGTTGTNNNTVTLDNAIGGYYDILSFADAGTSKWQLRKDGSNGMNWFDVVGGVNFINTVTGGAITLGKSQNLAIDASGFITAAGNSIGASGYIRLFNGLVLQWGIKASVGVGSFSVTYPTTFSNQTASVNFSMQSATGANTNNVVSASSTTGFTGTNNGGTTTTVLWMAIGF